MDSKPPYAIMHEAVIIDANSTGDPARFLSLAELEHRLTMLPPSPTDSGQVALIVRRGEQGRREVLPHIRLSVEEGVPGDSWGRRPDRTPLAQISVMQTAIAALIANDQPLSLFGDNLFLQLDLSATNLPPGSHVQVGQALLEVTALPHNGCLKLKRRFGDGALRFVAKPALRFRNLRGIYMRVLQPGEVKVGDAVAVIRRADIRTAGTEE